METKYLIVISFDAVSSEDINKLKKLNNYTFQHPLLIRNPYGTNTTAVYMYFARKLDEVV